MTNNCQLQYLMILLDGAAPSFCYYDAVTHGKGIMGLETLKHGIEFATKHSLGITAIYGTEILPEEHRQLLNAVPHVKIVPYREGAFFTDNSLVVLDAVQDASFPHRLLEREITHLVVTIDLQDALRLYTFIENNYRFFRRISVVFKGLEQADENMLNDFRLALQKLHPLLLNILWREKFTETGFATDRMMLHEMNNCNAGVTHLSLAPDGNFYICPGFYHDNSPPIGSLDNGIHIKNRQLYEFSHAPVCKRCDCYQCKRCVYLNKRTTLELNTPSHAQCVVSHHERNLSGILLDKLQNRGIMVNYPKIPPLFYLDPIDI